ncbi:hypothetical protein SBA1_10040 [Candidatus Sulfotelmatobacter kueseliae]|uniref:Uncharacterized protein n=1 Tax=Candidatus Sulfotelmatobacter kueseliae TaxID=2042962 RepID=A0A2U3JVD0_9BACT|nr:hypothetical protein SBA1_10040 [Candidatus Sulfotelmatobacter kueseliae]
MPEGEICFAAGIPSQAPLKNPAAGILHLNQRKRASAGSWPNTPSVTNSGGVSYEDEVGSNSRGRDIELGASGLRPGHRRRG